MSEQSSNIVSKVWGLCNPLRDDGVSYGDYLEQLTYLIFLKMSDEYSRPPYKRETGIPKGYTWSDMNTLKGAELENQYRAILERLGDEGGILGQIFKGAVNKISNVSILYRVVQMIDKENWVSMSSDVKGEIYEGLLQKNAEDVKSGVGGRRKECEDRGVCDRRQDRDFPDAAEKRAPLYFLVPRICSCGRSQSACDCDYQ